MDRQEQLSAFTYTAEAASFTFFVLATITFALRSVSRIWFVDTPDVWEDVIITVSWAFDVVRMVTLTLALHAVRGVDSQNYAQTVPNATFWALFTDSWCFLSVTLPKIAVALLLIRVFRPRPWIRKTFLGLSTGLFVVCIAGFVICFVQCYPIAGQWDPYSHPQVKCWPRNVQIDYALVASSISTAVDFLFAIYPAFVISSLQMSTWKKMVTIPLMGLGLTAFATGVVKVSQNGTLLGNPSLEDLYTHTMAIGLWNSIENDMIIVAACLPLVPAVFRGERLPSSKAFSKSRKDKGWRLGSVNSGSSRALPVSEQATELKESGEAPAKSSRGIHVEQCFSVEREDVMPGYQSQSYVNLV